MADYCTWLPSFILSSAEGNAVRTSTKLLAIAVLPTAAVFCLAAVSETADDASKTSFAVRVVDPHGKPVEGALVGQMAWRDVEVDDEWKLAGIAAEDGYEPAIADVDGFTKMFVEDVFRDKLFLTSRHTEKRLVGIKQTSREELVRAAEEGASIVVSVEPECRVFGQTTGLPPDAVAIAYVYADDVPLIEFVSAGHDVEFFLPPGEYRLEAYGTDCYRTPMPFQVEPGARELQLPTLALLPTPMAKLRGKPAPELRGVLAWKNSGPLALKEFRGNYVLLEFWGWWCGPCIHRMPELFELHDKYNDRGLKIIGVHVGLPDDQIDTAEELDEKLQSVKESVWDGRDVPFPVVMVESLGTMDDPRGGPGQERSLPAKDYGVRGYPTQILIDPEGQVVGHFDREKHLELIEALSTSR